MEQMDIPNGWLLKRFSLLNSYFAYFDTKDYLADSLFIKHQVRIRFLQEYVRNDSSYRVIFARCPKKKMGRVIAALQELTDKMLICGHSDYPDCCKNLMMQMQESQMKLHGTEMIENEPTGAS